MLGAILGDIVGSPYEFDHNNYKHKDFPLLSEKSHFTDDTVMTAAVAVGLIDGKGLPERTFCAVQHEMRLWGRKYPHAGYGGMFRRWLHAENPNPYGSFGNGSAMRVSAAGWLFDTLDKTLEMAKVTAEVTHNHPEGIKGAQATAAAIFLARTGHSKPEIKRYVEQTFGYDLNRTCDEIRPTYHLIMWRPVRKLCRKQSLLLWKASVLRMYFAMRSLWAATATPLPASPAALPKLFTGCRRNCGTRL